MNWVNLFFNDFILCLVAFTIHELGHVWMAKRRGIFLRVTAWKIFGFLPIGAFTWIDRNKATVQDQIDVATAGVWVGLPFTFLMIRPFTFLTAYMFASFFDILSITLLTICLFLGLPKNMTLAEVGEKYTLSIGWRGIKLKKMR